jgi:hypothetical protein
MQSSFPQKGNPYLLQVQEADQCYKFAATSKLCFLCNSCYKYTNLSIYERNNNRELE